MGLDPQTRTSFAHVAQSDGSELGVLSVGRFDVPVGAVVAVYGSRAFVLLADDVVTIGGGLDVGV